MVKMILVRWFGGKLRLRLAGDQDSIKSEAMRRMGMERRLL